MSTQAMTRQSPQALKFNELRRHLESPAVAEQIRRALPQGHKTEHMVRAAVSALQQNPKLIDCTVASVVRVVTQAAELGLELNTPLGLAYMIPYGKEATLQIGYKGLINLAHRSGKVSAISAEVVYANDPFQIELGTQRRLVHRPALGPRGEPIGAYAVVVFKDGVTDFEYMAADQIGAIKSRSRGADKDGSPWNHKHDYLEMWRKCPVRRLSKRLPTASEDFYLLARGAAIDEQYALDLAPPAPQPEAEPKIGQEQMKKLIAIAKGSGQNLTEILNARGFEMLADVTESAFEDVLAAVAAKPEPQPEGEAVDPDESKLIDLRTACWDELYRKVGNAAADHEPFLKGRNIDTMDAEALKTLHGDLLAL